MASTPLSEQTVTLLKRLAQKPVLVERCGLCDVELGAGHRHLVDPASRRIECACTACALLFEGQTGRYRLVPRDAVPLRDFVLDDLQWESLGLPIHLAFFFYNSSMGKIVALYPSPAGATESEIALETWPEIVAQNPRLQSLQADVEALLVNRVGESRDYYIAPIDRCYELVGIIRRDWRGFNGGDLVWQEIARFFDSLRGAPAAEATNA